MKLYTVKEVAGILRVDKTTVYSLISQRKLRAVRITPRNIRVPEDALREFLGEDRREAAAK